jgi:hypothetical protein
MILKRLQETGYTIYVMQEDLFKEEEKKLRRLRFIIDIAEAVLMQSQLTLRESLDLVDQTRKAALSLFPDKGSVYDLIYVPRFRRIIDERFTIPGSLSGRN